MAGYITPIPQPEPQMYNADGGWIQDFFPEWAAAQGLEPPGDIGPDGKPQPQTPVPQTQAPQEAPLVAVPQPQTPPEQTAVPVQSVSPAAREPMYIEPEFRNPQNNPFYGVVTPPEPSPAETAAADSGLGKALSGIQAPPPVQFQAPGSPGVPTTKALDAQLLNLLFKLGNQPSAPNFSLRTR